MEVHWVSIVNSCVLVVLMAILLIVILIKVLRNDMARYLDINEEELGMLFFPSPVFCTAYLRDAFLFPAFCTFDSLSHYCLVAFSWREHV